MSTFDLVAQQYLDYITGKKMHKPYQAIMGELQQETEITGKLICDLGCGPGEITCQLSELGGIVTGVDTSKILLNYARNRSDQVEWIHDDAMTLSKIKDESFDIVVSSLMLMDVPDHKAVFQQSYRILKAGGLMIWLIMHPCFQSPFSHPIEGGRKVSQYAPQYWKSHGTGTIRSTIGSYHRPVSYFINDFMKTGFVLQRVFEPGAEEAHDSVADYFGAIGVKIKQL